MQIAHMPLDLAMANYVAETAELNPKCNNVWCASNDFLADSIKIL